MNFIKTSLVVAMLSTFAYSSQENSELSVNGTLSFTNNYIFRGMTQTDNAPATQGTLNLGYKGFYLSTIGSNVKFSNLDTSMELDVLGGYSGEVSGLIYDIGAIEYMYPKSSKEANYAEAYIGISKDFEVAKIGAKFYKGIKTNEFDAPNAWEATLSVPLPKDISFDVLYGDWQDYGSYFSVGFTKVINTTFKLSLTYTGINSDINGANEDNVVATLSASF